MRVTEAYDILERNIRRLGMPSQREERIHGNTQGHRYTGMSKLVEAVNELSTVPGLQAECGNVQATTFFQTGTDGGVATQQDWNGLQELVNQLKNIATRVRDVLASMVAETSPNSIAVKLPNVTDLGEMRRVIGDLQVALERPVQMVLKEQITVEGVDRGSMWLVLVGSATMVVKFTFGMLYAANHYMRRQAELDRYVQHTQAIGALNEYVVTIQNANGKMMESVGDALTKQLLEGRAVDPEAVATTLNAIKTLAELRKQGLEMQLAANAPKELKEAYREFILPEMNVGELMPKIPRQLTAGANDGGTSDGLSTADAEDGPGDVG